jgi:ferritin-like metal-binding protein YciE
MDGETFLTRSFLLGTDACIIGFGSSPSRCTPGRTRATAIMGIIVEGQQVMKEFKSAPALDAGLLAAAQAVENYEIAHYGTLKTWAAELGLNQVAKLLETILGEEKKTNETLTQLAQSEVNKHARAM